MNTSTPIALDKPALAAAWLAAIGWAATGIFVRYLSDLSLLTLVGGRCAVALLAILPVIVFITRGRQLRADLQQPVIWPLSALMLVYYLLAVEAFRIAPVVEVALLISASPIFTLAIRVLRRQTTPGVERWGSLLAFLGVVLIVAPHLSWAGDSAQRLLGDVLALLSAAAMSVYSILYLEVRRQGRAPAAQNVALHTFLGATLLWLAYLGLSEPGFAAVPVNDPTALWLFLGLGTVATVLPTIWYSVASQRISAMLVTSTRLLTPVFAGLFALLFLGEIPSGWFWPGAALVLIGLLIMARPAPAG